MRGARTLPYSVRTKRESTRIADSSPSCSRCRLAVNVRAAGPSRPHRRPALAAFAPQRRASRSDTRPLRWKRPGGSRRPPPLFSARRPWWIRSRSPPHLERTNPDHRPRADSSPLCSRFRGRVNAPTARRRTPPPKIVPIFPAGRRPGSTRDRCGETAGPRLDRGKDSRIRPPRPPTPHMRWGTESDSRNDSDSDAFRSGLVPVAGDL